MVIVTWVGEVGCASWKINYFFKGVSVSVYAERPRNAVSVNGAYLL